MENGTSPPGRMGSIWTITGTVATVIGTIVSVVPFFKSAETPPVPPIHIAVEAKLTPQPAQPQQAQPAPQALQIQPVQQTVPQPSPPPAPLPSRETDAASNLPARPAGSVVPPARSPGPTYAVEGVRDARAFEAGVVTSNNDNASQRGRSAYSFDRNPESYFSFVSSAAETIIEIEPKTPGAVLSFIKYRNPPGVDPDGLIQSFSFEIVTSDGRNERLRIQIDPLREDWQSTRIKIRDVELIRLRPGQPRAGRIVAVGKFMFE